MTAQARATRKPLGSSGQRILFRTEKACELARTWIVEDHNIQFYSNGLNSYPDKDEWPYYIYITRKTSGSSLDDSDIRYLDSLVGRLDTVKSDLVENEIAEIVGPADDEVDDTDEVAQSAADTTGVVQGKAPKSAVWSASQEIRTLEAGIAARIDDLASSLRELAAQFGRVSTSVDKKLDMVKQSVDDKIEGLRSQEIRDAVKLAEQGIESAADVLLEEASKRLEEGDLRIQELQFSVKDIEMENDNLNTKLSEYDTKLSELRDDMENQTSRRQGVEGWQKYDILLAKQLCNSNCSDLFWNHLRDRLGNSVPIDKLVEAIRRIQEGKTKGRELSRNGHTTFYEYKCNLGEGSSTGRLYFHPGDGFCLLGFGGKDHQDADIDLIFQTRKS